MQRVCTVDHRKDGNVSDFFVEDLELLQAINLRAGNRAGAEGE